MLDRINRWFADRLPSRRLAEMLVRVSPDGLHFRQPGGAVRILSWADVDRVVATLSPQLLGDTRMLLFDATRGDGGSVNEADPAWGELMGALHLHLPGAKRATTWQLELVASRGPTGVYLRDARS